MVTQAKPSKEWELKNSAYILLGLFPWLDAFAFVYIGKKTGRKQWIRQGMIFGGLWYFWTVFLIMTNTYSYMIKGAFVRQMIFMVRVGIPLLWPLLLILLLASRKDYLRLLFWNEKQTQKPKLMCEKGWRKKHSLWTIWSFIPGFGGISLLIGGYALENKTWKKIGWAVTAVGMAAIALLNSMGTFALGLPYSTHSFISKLSLVTIIMIFPLQIALMLGIYREYMEHEAVTWEMKQQKYECLSSFNWRMKNSWWILLCIIPYCGGAGLIAAGLNSKKKNWAASGLFAEVLITVCAVLSRVIPSTNENRMITGVIGILYNLIMLAVFAMACIIRNEYLFIRAKQLGGNETEIQQELEVQEKFRKHMKDKKPVQSTETAETEEISKMPETQKKTDINICTEEELSRLPGLSLSQVKKAMEYREENGFFNSVDDFISVLGIKPHFAVQILEKTEANPVAVSKKNTGEKDCAQDHRYMMQIHHIEPLTRAEGPGVRYTIWVQGCKNACKGCYAKDTWKTDGGRKTAVEDIISDIERLSDQIEGVTFLGGEPMLQAKALSFIAERVRALGKSVITFTGLTLEEIKGNGEESQLALVENTDVLIDGPYMEEKRDFSRPLAGSSNQRFHFLTNRYSMEDFLPNRIEIRLGKNGVVRANGMGDFSVLEDLLKKKGMKEMACSEFELNFSNLVNAGFPYVYISSYEEERVIAAISAVNQKADFIKAQRKIYIWAQTTGFVSEESRVRDTMQPVQALDYIGRSNEDGIFILKDFHVYFGGERNTRPDSMVIRKLRDILPNLKSSRKMVVFLSPQLMIPADMEKEISVLDFPLPTETEIEETLDELLAGLPAGNIHLNADEKQGLVRAALGLTLQEAENAFCRAIVHLKGLNKSALSIIHEEKNQVVRKTGVLEFVKSDLDIDDIGGLENLKNWLKKRNNSWQKRARAYHIPAPKGVLITGVPGCGKSLTAKAMSAIWNLPLLKLDMGKIFGGIVGSSEENIRKAIRTAEAVAPSILWVDEIEKGFAGTKSDGDSGTSARVFGTFLTWMQDKTDPVFVIATSNDISALPPELLRKGRFDEIFFVDLPTQKEREKIFMLHLKKRISQSDIAHEVTPDAELCRELAALAKGFSGAEIEQAVIAALYEAFFAERGLRREDLIKSIRETVPLSVTQQEQILKLRQWAANRAVLATARDDREDMQQEEETAFSGQGGRIVDFDL